MCGEMAASADGPPSMTDQHTVLYKFLLELFIF